jgi:hypothetical protein
MVRRLLNAVTMKPFAMIATALSLGAVVGCSGGAPLTSGATGGNGSAGSGDAIACTTDCPAPPVCSGNPRGGAEVPSEHRAVATACDPSRRTPPLPEGGAPSCVTDADCANDAGSDFTTCRLGLCSYDRCLTDADCGTGVCSCANYGGPGAERPNLCIPANCHVDSDCGAGGYCSPSHGYCGSYIGYNCHGKKDSCVDAVKDCTRCGNSCSYDALVGAFVCAMVSCTG